MLRIKRAHRRKKYFPSIDEMRRAQARRWAPLKQGERSKPWINDWGESREGKSWIRQDSKWVGAIFENRQGRRAK